MQNKKTIMQKENYLKTKTAELIYSNSLTAMNNIRYLTNFVAPDPFLLVSYEKKYYLIVSSMEEGRARRETKKGVKVFTPSALGLHGKQVNNRNIIEKIILKLGIKKLKVTKNFPIGLFQEIEKRGIKICIGKDEVHQKRRRKKKIEIEYIKESQNAAVKAMLAVKLLLKNSEIKNGNKLFFEKKQLTAERIREEAQKVLFKYGCIGSDIIVAGGEQAIDPHERGFGPLYSGEAIIIDIFPKNEKTGYWGDLTRTICKGKPSKELKHLYKTVLSAQLSALKSVKAGVCGDQIHNEVQTYFERCGYKTDLSEIRNIGFIHGTGHGVGLDIHEAPRIGKSGDILKSGDIITVEPGLYYPGLGGVRIEDTVCVTTTGFEMLKACPKKFIIN